MPTSTGGRDGSGRSRSAWSHVERPWRSRSLPPWAPSYSVCLLIWGRSLSFLSGSGPPVDGPTISLVLLFLGGSPLAAAIHLADAIPDRDADRAAGLRTLAVALGTPRAELAAAGLLLLGSLVSTILVIRRGQSSTAALSLVAVVASGLVVGLSSRAGRLSSLFGKWMVIAAAALAAVPLVAQASGR